jgi:antitoxin ParD1/3/4
MATRNIVLTEHHDTLVSRLVKAGRYQNASEVLREGLRLVEEKEVVYQQKLLELRDALSDGLADVDAGRTLTLGVGEDISEYLSKRASEITQGG